MVMMMTISEINKEIRLYELALRAWEYLTIEQECDAIQNIIRLRKLKKAKDYGAIDTASYRRLCNTNGPNG